jgi:hypothetical protein
MASNLDWKDYIRKAATLYAEAHPDKAFMVALLEDSAVPYFVEANPDAVNTFEEAVSENGC